jgi:hypothetical protein
MAGLHDWMNPDDVRMGSLAKGLEPSVEEPAAPCSELVTGTHWI